MVRSMLDAQNLEENIRKLKAQRALYSSAKYLSGLQLVLNVFIVITLSIAVLLFSKGWLITFFGWSKADYSWVLASYSFCIIFIDLLVLAPLIEKRKERAAKIQQSFDTHVLSLKWNKSFYGTQPINEMIITWSKKFKGNETELKDWYSNQTGSLPENICRLVCQRTNCWWDSKIRKRYNHYLYITGCLLVVILLSISLAINIDIQRLFSTLLAPLTPFFIFAIKTISDNKKVVSRLKEVIEEVNEEWNKILTENHSENELATLSNSIQHSIFLNRKESPLIFDFVYNRSRNDYEETMNMNAEDFVSQYQRAKRV